MKDFYIKLQQERGAVSVRYSSVMSPLTVLFLLSTLIFAIPQSESSSHSVSQNLLLSPEDLYDVELGAAEQSVLQDLQKLKSRVRILKKRAQLNGLGGKIRILKTSDPQDYRK